MSFYLKNDGKFDYNFFFNLLNKHSALITLWAVSFFVD